MMGKASPSYLLWVVREHFEDPRAVHNSDLYLRGEVSVIFLSATEVRKHLENLSDVIDKSLPQKRKIIVGCPALYVVCSGL